MNNNQTLNPNSVAIEDKFVQYARESGSKEPWRYSGPRGHIRGAVFKALKFDLGEEKVRFLYPDLALDKNERFFFCATHSIFCHKLELSIDSGLFYKEAFQIAKEDMEITVDIFKEVENNKKVIRQMYSKSGKPIVQREKI